MPNLLFVCTGNAHRSVLAGAMVAAARPDWVIRTAGTLVVEGLPVSVRTEAAMDAVGVSVPGHRSVQLRSAHLTDADLVVALAIEHVAYIRRRHPEAADRTGTLRRLIRELAPPPPSLPDRVAALGLATLPLEAWEDVDDPAGQDVDAFVACAHEIRELVDGLIAVLQPPMETTGEAVTR